MKKMLQFNFATDGESRILLGSISEYFPRLSSRRVRQLIVLRYTARKEVR